MLEGTTRKFSMDVSCKASLTLHLPDKTSYNVKDNSSLEIPIPEVEFPWGSASISRIFSPERASDAARLIAVVVFPTPPFWLAIAIILFINLWYYNMLEKYSL